MARRAYDDFKRDVQYALRPNPRASNNSAAEVEAWETVKNGINEETSTFSVGVYNVDEVSWGTPKAIGSSYQVLGGRWKQQTSSQMVSDTTTGYTIAAPSQWSGQFAVSYKFSPLRAMWAAIVWFFELLARLLTVAVVVVLLALLIYYVPWSKVPRLGVTVSAIFSRGAPLSPTPTPSAPPQATPTGDTTAAVGYGTSRVVVGKSPSSSPD